MGGTRTRPSAWQISKNPQNIRSRRSYISVAVSESQLIKLIKPVTLLVKKREVTATVCVFYEKRRLKIQSQLTLTAFLFHSTLFS